MNALRSFIALTLLLCAVAPLASAKKAQKKSERKASVYISITNEGTDYLGIFFVGNETERSYPPAPPGGGITVAPNADFETMTAAIRPGEHVQQGIQFDTAFVVRTGDMSFRAKIIVSPGEDRPYVLSFKNLMSEKVQPTSRAPTGVVMMELKHSNSGYVWIEPASAVSHGTDADHDFQLRDKSSNPICTIRLKDAHDEL